MYFEILLMPGKFLDGNFGNNFRIKGFKNFEKNLHVFRNFAKIFETF